MSPEEDEILDFEDLVDKFPDPNTKFSIEKLQNYFDRERLKKEQHDKETEYKLVLKYFKQIWKF